MNPGVFLHDVGFLTIFVTNTTTVSLLYLCGEFDLDF